MASAKGPVDADKLVRQGFAFFYYGIVNPVGKAFKVRIKRANDDSRVLACGPVKLNEVFTVHRHDYAPLCVSECQHRLVR